MQALSSDDIAIGQLASMRWDERGLDELISHLLERYHRPLHAELARLEQLAKKVRRVHGTQDPERLSRLAETVVALREELESHMQKEEQVLFPWIRSGGGTSAMLPILRKSYATGGWLSRPSSLLFPQMVAPSNTRASPRASPPRGGPGMEVRGRKFHLSRQSRGHLRKHSERPP
ncbi:MAG: hemerythrin domain-containing protein [Archangium sp.]